MWAGLWVHGVLLSFQSRLGLSRTDGQHPYFVSGLPLRSTLLRGGREQIGRRPEIRLPLSIKTGCLRPAQVDSIGQVVDVKDPLPPTSALPVVSIVCNGGLPIL